MMARAGQGSGAELERVFMSLLRFDRLWWWLAVVAAVSLVGQEIARSSLVVRAAAAEFEGFGDDELDEDEADEVPFVVPPPAPQKPGFQNDRGPPEQRPRPPRQPAPPVEREREREREGLGLDDEEARPSREQEKKIRAEQPKSRFDQYWDEDEFEGLPVEAAEGEDRQQQQQDQQAGKERPAAATAKRPPPPLTRSPQSLYIEFCSIAFIAAFAVVYYYGRKANEALALAWAAQYAGKDSVFDKNFSLLGTGDGQDSPLLMKEGQNVFKFYASGRRYCEGLLATMDLESRHDLIARMWYAIAPRKDEITIEVFMNDENMDPVVFALARKKNAKALHKDVKDLNQFATILSASSQRRWVSDELVVISESREVAADLLTDALLDQVFGERAFEKHASNFVSLHFTDQNPYGSHKKLLQFKFTLPPVERIAEISRLVSIVPYFIDAVGRYKLSPQARAKADNARSKIAQEVFKENQSARLEALQKKKEERRKALEDAENSKLSPEALRKKDEKERMRQLKKSMPKAKMTRAH